jgi:putative hydrolase of the HAD superfamily
VRSVTASRSHRDIAGRPTVVLDGDDTLWFVESLYDDARQLAANVVHAEGLDELRWERLERQIDVNNVGTLGLSTERFPASCVEAYRRLATETQCGVSASVEARIRRAAETVFHRKAPSAPELGDLLAKLHEQFTVVLLTKGDEMVQRKRIADAGIADAIDYISIVPEKSEKNFRSVLAAVGSGTDDAWSVGNSLASDINPALRIGMRAIWIDSHVWEYERRESAPEPGSIVIATDLSSAVRKLLAANTDGG